MARPGVVDAGGGGRPATLLELPIVRLQVQLGRIKPGRAPWRRYQPEVLREVRELIATPDGVVGVDANGTEFLDVHNTSHPQSRDRKGRNGISIMSTGDYAALRQRYGEHLADGIAAEGILVDYRPGLARRSMPASAMVRSRSTGAELPLVGLHIAEPCVEFTRFCLGLEPSDRVGDDVTAGLADLGGGARGYKMVAASLGRIRIGDVFAVEVS